MIVSQYQPKEDKVLKDVITDLIFCRKLKSISSTTERPAACLNGSQGLTEVRNFDIVKKVQVDRKIIEQARRKHDVKKVKMELKLQEKYNRWLLNYLHKTAVVELNSGVHALSILGTMEEPEYPGQNYENTSYRKDYPHHSNVMKCTEMPSDLCRHIVMKPQKISNYERQRNIFENTCVKMVTVIRFIFKYLKSKAEHFQQIAQELMQSVKVVKMLFDILSSCFKLQKQYEKLQRLRVRDKAFKEQYYGVCRTFKIRIEEIFRKKQPGSSLIPREHLWVSLKELHDMIVEAEF